MGKRVAVTLIADRVEESPEVSELVTHLEEEADRQIAAGTVSRRAESVLTARPRPLRGTLAGLATTAVDDDALFSTTRAESSLD